VCVDDVRSLICNISWFSQSYVWPGCSESYPSTVTSSHSSSSLLFATHYRFTSCTVFLSGWLTSRIMNTFRSFLFLKRYVLYYTFYLLTNWAETCHMVSHSVTCRPTQVNASHLKLSYQIAGVSWYLICLPWTDGSLSWLRLPGNAPAGSRTHHLSITSLTMPWCLDYGANTDTNAVSRCILRAKCDCGKPRSGLRPRSRWGSFQLSPAFSCPLDP